MGIFRRIFKSKLKLPIVVVIFTVLAIYIPGGESNDLIGTILGVVGLLFAIVVGFFINDLWSRYQTIRENVAIEVSGLQTYYQFVKVLGKASHDHKEWQEKQRELIDGYIKEFFNVEWYDYSKVDPHFNKIVESMEDVGELKTDKEVEIFSNLIPMLNEITTARAKLFMYGKDRLSSSEWFVVYFLAIILLFSIFFINSHDLFSIFLVGMLSSSVIALLFILHDLNDLNYGEETISFESYETIFDTIDKPRYYRKEDVASGRVSLPANKDYRTDET